MLGQLHFHRAKVSILSDASQTMTASQRPILDVLHLDFVNAHRHHLSGMLQQVHA
jgi:hypothetical protein